MPTDRCVASRASLAKGASSDPSLVLDAIIEQVADVCCVLAQGLERCPSPASARTTTPRAELWAITARSTLVDWDMACTQGRTGLVLLLPTGESRVPVLRTGVGFRGTLHGMVSSRPLWGTPYKSEDRLHLGVCDEAVSSDAKGARGCGLIQEEGRASLNRR